MPVGQSAARFTDGELGVGVDDGSAAFRLGQHDGVRFCRRHGVEIGVGETGLQTVDAHHEIGPVCAGGRFLQKRRRTVAGTRLAIERNRIFQVDDQRIGAARHRTIEFLGAVGRHEKQRAHHESIFVVIAGARASRAQ